MSIEQIRPDDDIGLAEAHEVLAASAVGEYATPWTWPEFCAAARTTDPWTEKLLLLARDELGMPVASAELELPTHDNTDQVWSGLRFRPEDAQSAPVGARADELVERVKAVAREHGRAVILADAEWELDDCGIARRRVLERNGFSLGLSNAHRVLDLPVDGSRLEVLSAEVAPRHAAYRLVAWHGRCPDEWVDEYAALRSRMLDDAPRGELPYAGEDFGVERVRHEEDELAAQGRTLWTTIAVDADGTVAGHTQLVVSVTDEVNAFQWDTLVLPEHRGHRLGIALKTQNLFETVGALGPRTRLHTWNAVDNTPMVEVNDRLGFRVVGYLGEFQCRV